MGFLSFAGRALFAAAFLLSAYQEFNEFGVDGGPAAKALEPKFNTVVANISTHTGLVVPHIELKHVIGAMIALKGLGGLLFILSSSLGAYLLNLKESRNLPVIYVDKHNPVTSSNPIIPFAAAAAISQALHASVANFYKLLHLAFITPIVHDFYNYDIESAEFVQLFTKFAQNCALVGALLFFLAMKNSIPKRLPNRKKAPKPKAN